MADLEHLLRIDAGPLPARQMMNWSAVHAKLLAISAYRPPARERWLEGNRIVFSVFLTLRLARVVDWSWWWAIVPFCVALSIILVSALRAGLVCPAQPENRRNDPRRRE